MVRVLLFAELEEKLGKREVDFSYDEITIGELREKLIESYPELTAVRSAMVAINEEFAEDDVKAHDGDLVAFIPPVSGG